MMRRQADEEGAAIANLGVVPGVVAENSIARKASTAKSRTKALARRLRKSSRMASLTADVSEGIEEIAGFSDRIMESIDQARRLMDQIVRESLAGSDFLQSLGETLPLTRDVSAEASSAIGELALAGKPVAESLRGIVADIQDAAQNHNDIQKHIQELNRIYGGAEEFSGQLNRLLERADISGINAALEAERVGETGAGFAVVAAIAQKDAAAFERKTAGAAGLIERIKTAHENLSGNTTETSERIRAIGVMTKGVRNAFSEAEESFRELIALAEEVAFRTRGIVEGFGGAIPGALPEITDRVIGSIDLAASRLAEQEQRFAETAGYAEQLLASTGKLASGEDMPIALDAIYTDTDTFIRALEATRERLELSLAAIQGASADMGLLREGSGADRENLKCFAETVQETRGVALNIRERTAALRESLGNSLSVLKDVVRELALLRDESVVISGEIGALRLLYRGISRISGYAGVFAARMGSLAVTSGMEASRAGEKGAEFAAFSGEFEAVACEADELEQSAYSLYDRLEDHLFSITGHQAFLDWRRLGDSFDRLISGLQTLIETRLSAAGEKGAVLADTISRHNERITEVFGKTSGMEQAAEEAVRVVETAGDAGEKQRAAFLKTIATAEKISSLADELYPDVD